MNYLQLSEKVLEMIEDDILRCEHQINLGYNGSQRLFYALISKYSTIYEDFEKEIPGEGKISARGQERDYTDELYCVKEKLEMIKLTGVIKQNSSNPGIQIYNSNINQNSSFIQQTYQDSRKKIFEMGSLTEDQKNEALKNIDEINTIASTKSSNDNKWQKLKPYVRWLADKSMDLFIAVVPLIIQALVPI